MKAYVIAAGVAAVAFAGALALANKSQAGSDMTLRPANVSGPWPLTVSEIKVECDPDLAIYGKVGNRTYPLNGEAERRSMFYGKGPVTRLEDIQKNDPWSNQFIPDAKMSMDPITQAAIKRCEDAGRWLRV